MVEVGDFGCGEGTRPDTYSADRPIDPPIGAIGLHPDSRGICSIYLGINSLLGRRPNWDAINVEMQIAAIPRADNMEPYAIYQSSPLRTQIIGAVICYYQL